MLKMDEIQKRLLEEVADLHDIPVGAYNLRANGESAGRRSTANIEILSKKDVSGLDINIKDGTVNQSVHIPVVLSTSGLSETVYNDFHVGTGCDVLIVAGCGIDNCGSQDSEHDGIHRFYVGKNSKVRYVEKHYGEGDGEGKRVLDPVTEVHLGKNSSLEMHTTQIKGVDSTIRQTSGELDDGASLVVLEKIMTHGHQTAETQFTVDLNGKGSRTQVTSRSVATEFSQQKFVSKVYGNNECFGHVECDAIIKDSGKVVSTPEISANCVDANLIHEAAIGKIAGEQIIKLETLGLTEKEAEAAIIDGFLK